MLDKLKTMKKWKKAAAAAGFLSVFVLGILFFKNGFSGKESGSESGYTDAQTMLIIATEANRYRSVYTDEIWNIPVGPEKEEFQSYLLKQIRSFIKEVKTMNLLADERGIRLTGEEQEKLRQLSSEFYQSLTAEDLACTGASEEDVYVMYEAYHRANRLVDQITENVDLEISDSEARVMTVQELKFSSEGEALESFRRLTEEEISFDKEARAVCEDGLKEKLVGRGECSKAYEEAVFSLENDQLSRVFQDGDSWYIVKCVNAYNEGATLERKEKLALQRKNQAFRQIYNRFAQEHPVEIQGNIWEETLLSDMKGSTTGDFFERYRIFMNEK